MHADAVVEKVYNEGFNVFRFDPETEWCASAKLDCFLGVGQESIALRCAERSVNFSDIAAVYCRNWNFLRAPTDAPIEEHLRLHEMKAGLFGAFRCLENVYWMNPPWMEDLVDNKIIQSKNALARGLQIPRTLVTNNPTSARQFWHDCGERMIIKQLSEICLFDDPEERQDSSEPGEEAFGFYTSLVEKEQLELIDQVRYAPCLLQECIEKILDLRVTVVGDKLFAHSLDTRHEPRARVDFRLDEDPIIAPYEFPKREGDILLELVKSWGLQFATCDFLLDQKGQVYFLEANVSGNWLWCEESDDHPILDEIALQLIHRLSEA